MAEAESIGIETFGLGPEALELVREVFRRHPEVREVRVFGSRATGHFADNSDVDLAVRGSTDPRIVGRIIRELDELPLPYIFDVQAYDAIRHPPLRQHIDEVGKTLYCGQSAS